MTREANGGAPDDELTKGLPGLPFNERRLRVESTGVHYTRAFGRGEIEIRWADLAGIGHTRLWALLYARRPDGSVGKRVSATISPWAERAIYTAWREFLLRRTEREGKLTGTVLLASLKEQAVVTAVMLAACVFGAVATIIWPPADEIGVEGPTPLWLSWLWPGVFLMLSLYSLAALGEAVLAVRELRADWSRWELRPDGLAYGPGGRERLLSLSPGDVVWPRGAEITGTHVRFACFTGGHALVPLILAMAERAGADVRPYVIRASVYATGAVAVAVVIAVAAFVAVVVFVKGPGIVPDVGKLVATMVVVLAIVAGLTFLGRYVIVRDFETQLEYGREALQRLGWQIGG